jgi:hypothetical protein
MFEIPPIPDAALLPPAEPFDIVFLIVASSVSLVVFFGLGTILVVIGRFCWIYDRYNLILVDL